MSRKIIETTENKLNKKKIEASSKTKEQLAKELEKKRMEDREMVRGTFRYHEQPGFHLKFCFLKYKGDPLEVYDLQDGETYTIPLGVARHLNSSGFYPSYEYIKDHTGNHTTKMTRKVNRYSFISNDLEDDETYKSLDTNLVTCERMEIAI